MYHVTEYIKMAGSIRKEKYKSPEPPNEVARLVVTGFDTDGEILICAHTVDSYMRRLDSYNYYSTYPVHIEKVNTW